MVDCVSELILRSAENKNATIVFADAGVLLDYDSSGIARLAERFDPTNP